MTDPATDDAPCERHEQRGVIYDLASEIVPVSALRTFHANPRKGNVTAICRSLLKHGQYRPIVVNRGTFTGRENEVLAGNHTLQAHRVLADEEPSKANPTPEQWATIAVVWVDVDDDQAARIVAADNRTSDLGEYDDRLLAELLGSLPDLDGTGYDPGDLDDILARLDADTNAIAEGLSTSDSAGSDEPEDSPSLADRFLVPPFDVLDARQGWWRDRKKAWLALGIQSETGRSGWTYDDDGNLIDTKTGLIYSHVSSGDPQFYDKKRAAEKRLGRTMTTAEFAASDYYTPPENTGIASGTSVFDPVLCELAYRWFSPEGGTIVDPFAGGSVRGLVAAMLGRRYIGNDLSANQITANQAQADDFAARGLLQRDRITWTTGDSADWHPEPDSADLLFTCPPYLWLEQYNPDDPADLSNMDATEFEEVYTRILSNATRALRNDRFAVIVVGDARDTKGRLHDLRGITVRAAENAGLTFHSGAVLITAVGSLAIRAARQFESSRVLGRTHQDVLVFVKGDRKRAAQACGNVAVDLPDDLEAAFTAPATNSDGETMPEDYTPDYTPVETHAGIQVKRDDAWRIGGATGAKARTMHRLAIEKGAAGIITAGARRSPQIERAALVAAHLGIPCRVHVPDGATTPEITTCEKAGAEVIRHKHGRLSVLKARFRDDTAEHPDWLHVPFGMDMDDYRADVAQQVANLPTNITRIVTPCGSGSTLAGILTGLDQQGLDIPVLAVQVGHDPTATLDRCYPTWRDRVQLVKSELDYDTDAPTTRLGTLGLDPMYEAKCLPYLQDGDLLWAVGIRTNNAP